MSWPITLQSQTRMQRGPNPHYMHGKDDDNGDCMKTYRKANEKEEYSLSFIINTTLAHILVVYVDQIIVMVSPDRPMRVQEGRSLHHHNIFDSWVVDVQDGDGGCSCLSHTYNPHKNISFF